MLQQHHSFIVHIHSPISIVRPFFHNNMGLRESSVDSITITDYGHIYIQVYINNNLAAAA